MEIEQFYRAVGCTKSRASLWFEPIQKSMRIYSINTPIRQAAFLAQIGHESLGLIYITELWGPTSSQLRYEGRTDLGNTEKGDGYRFRGRGPIQITGRYNYQLVSNALKKDFIEDPDSLALPEWSSKSSCWWWQKNSCNIMADNNEFEKITRRINGGLNGLSDRYARWKLAKEALGISP